MCRKAASRGLQPVNPVDRFVLLIRKGIHCHPLATVLRHVGMSQLLHSLELGRYDFIADQPPSLQQRRARAQICSEVLYELDRSHSPVI